MKKILVLLTAYILININGVVNAETAYLNGENITVSLGSSMAPDPFENRSTVDSLASIIDALSAEESEIHDQTTHVWVSGGSLELNFDLGVEYNLTMLHFWNYFSEGFDVDNIDFTFFDSSNSLVGSLLNVTPELGGGGSNPIFAENYALSFPSNVQFIKAVLTGTNNEVDFNNIGFTGELSTSCTEKSSGFVSPNLDIHLSSVDYATPSGILNLRADLEYLGTNSEGQHIWGLTSVDVNQ